MLVIPHALHRDRNLANSDEMRANGASISKFFVSHRNDIVGVISLIAIQCLVFGPFLRSLGFYWDDWPVVWTYNAFGASGPAAYFTGDRPVVGWMYSQLFPLFGTNPFEWQLMVAIIQSACLIGVFVAFRALWPERRDVAWLLAVLVLLYPGFTQQPIALTYLPHYLSFAFFTLSLATTIYAATKPRYRWMFFAASLLAEGATYFTTEYFLGLEIVRLLAIWSLVRQRGHASRFTDTSKTAMVLWAPYAVLWAGYLIWRTFIFHTVAIAHYKEIGPRVQEITSHPLREVVARIVASFHNILMATVFAWTRPFSPDLFMGGFRILLLEWGLSVMAGVSAVLVIQRISARTTEPNNRPGSFSRDGFVLALGGLLASGLPLLVSNLRAEFTSSPSYDDRITIPFTLASSLMLVVLLGRVRRPKVVLIGVIVCVFSVFQIQNENQYRHDWLLQKALFWQAAWRAPVLAPGTSIFADGLPKSLYKNHTAGMLEMMYENHDSSHLAYFIFDLDQLPATDSIASFKVGEPTVGSVRFHKFHGSTSQSVVWWISPSGTLRMIGQGDPGETLRCSALCFNLSQVSKPGRVISDGPTPDGPLLRIFGSEPKRGWLYYFQRAELERQLGHWDSIAALGEKAKRQGCEPMDPSEWFPFIDGYARAGKYTTAEDLSKHVIEQAPDAIAPLSSLWRGVIHDNASNTAELESVREVLGEQLNLTDRREGTELQR